jgi:hypothetical protein
VGVGALRRAVRPPARRRQRAGGAARAAAGGAHAARGRSARETHHGPAVRCRVSCVEACPLMHVPTRAASASFVRACLSVCVLQACAAGRR